MSDSKITPRDTDYNRWYQDVINAAQLIDSSPVRGCMVLRPNGFALWENIKSDLDRRFKETGHVNAYFPMFIPQSFLEKEAEHVEGFAKECALVTHHRLRAADGGGLEPDPNAKLEEPLVVRPTSETIIWHMYGRWIQSYRDLPILINQWANVVRWEMRTRPFLRTAEFLWQEGHTAHASESEAREEAVRMLEVYRDFCYETLAVPVVTGVKTATERFAGAEDTYTIEAMMQNGWALQSGTSHFLGQNFAKAFDVTFQTENHDSDFVWATSWGVSTRLIGALIMTHSDDTGLVLPPKVAHTQIVIVPIWRKAHEQETVLAFANEVFAKLKSEFRVVIDDRDNMKPGNKYYEWERKGVPLRLEIGPRDVKNNSVFSARRLDRAKEGIEVNESFTQSIQVKLDEIQRMMLENAIEQRNSKTHDIQSYNELKDNIGNGGFFIAPWADSAVNEAAIKEDCKATIRCYPSDRQSEANGQLCFYSQQPATHMAIFARAY
ncbi:MAG: proline--tRNA ligase [Myxococcota bacterium]